MKSIYMNINQNNNNNENENDKNDKIKESFDNPSMYDDLNIYDEQYNKYINLKYYVLGLLVILILLFIFMYFVFKR